MVLDPHTHAWGAPSSEHPWTNGWLLEEFASHFDTDIIYRDEDLLADMDEAGIDEAVVVGYPITDWTDNWYTVKAAVENDRLEAVVMLDHFADDAPQRLRELMAHDGVLGFRFGAICPIDEQWQSIDHGTTWLRDSVELPAFWDAVADTDALVQIMVHTSQLDQVLELVEAHPDRAFALDHFCDADVSKDPAEPFPHCEELAEFDRVAMKISEVSIFSEEAYPYEDAYEHVRWLLDTFGRERVIWASDYPNVSHTDFGDMAYEETLSWLDHVPFLSEKDREWLTGRSFRDLVTE